MQMIDGVGVGVVSVSGCLVSGASGGRRTGMMSSPSTWQFPENSFFHVAKLAGDASFAGILTDRRIG